MFTFLINFFNETLCVNEEHQTVAFNLSDAISQITDEYPYLIDGYDYEVSKITISETPQTNSEKAAFATIQSSIDSELEIYHNTSNKDSATYILDVKIGSLLSNIINICLKR